MKTRRLGHSDLEVPVIMLGGNVFDWTVNESESFRLLDAAFDAGLNFIDTANMYSTWVPGHQGGESEAVIGKWFARSGKRDQVVIATKVGMQMGDGSKGLAPAYIAKCVEDSLKRLQTDRIDLYQAHKDDESTPLEETLGTFDKLIKQGKVRYIGASNYSGARLRQAMETSAKNGLAAYQSLQPLYNLMEREPYESDLAPVVAEYGIGVVPFFSLASGFLTGKYRKKDDLEGKARGGGVGKYLNERGFAVLDALDAVAKEYRTKPASVALAWLIARPGITAPIASATKVEHIHDMVEAANLTLDTSAMERLNEASAPVAAA